jgi:membrane dipeptidase
MSAPPVIIDGHTDVPTRQWEAPANLGESRPDRHIDEPRLRRGKVDALVCALWVPSALDPVQGLRHARELERLTRLHLPSSMRVARTEEEIRRFAGRGEIAVIFALENGLPLIAPRGLTEIADLGVRYITLTHNGTHDWCDSSTDEPQHGGLSPEGIDLMRSFNRLGILADVSHASDEAIYHVLEYGLLPPLASHSSARSLCDQPRNLPDDLVREIARRDGLVMANSYPAFLSAAAGKAAIERHRQMSSELEESETEYLSEPQRVAPLRAAWIAEHPLPRVPLSALVDHIIYLVDLAGEEHVGVGSDFDGIPDTLEGFEDVSCFPSLAGALRDRGVDRRGLELIMGENFLRLLGVAERAAGSAQRGQQSVSVKNQ